MKPSLEPIQFDFYTVPLRCCHVEDLIELAPATPLLILIPEDYSSYDDFEEWAQMGSFSLTSIVTFDERKRSGL
jgi:hypothetical protein